MGKAIVITSGKGGVGKTTITANLGVALALRGKQVVVMDADIGLRNLDVVMGLENRIVFDMVDVARGTCRLKQALVRDKRYEGLYLLPASQSCDKNALAPEQMQQMVQQLKEQYDYVLIDCPAGIEQGFQNAIAGADEALVVVVPEVSSVRDADRVIGLLAAADMPAPKLIVNRYNQQLARKGDMMNEADMLEVLGVSSLGVVPEDNVVVRSANIGSPLAAGTGAAAQAVRGIAALLCGEQAPAVVPQGWRFKMRRLFSKGA